MGTALCCRICTAALADRLTWFSSRFKISKFCWWTSSCWDNSRMILCFSCWSSFILFFSCVYFSCICFNFDETCPLLSCSAFNRSSNSLWEEYYTNQLQMEQRKAHPSQNYNNKKINLFCSVKVSIVVNASFNEDVFASRSVSTSRTRN